MLSENPFIEVSLDSPAVKVHADGRVQVSFEEKFLRVDHQQLPGLTLTFRFDPASSEYGLTASQPFEAPPDSRRPADAGSYAVALPWQMLTPFLALLGRGQITATVTKDTAEFFCTFFPLADARALSAAASSSAAPPQ